MKHWIEIILGGLAVAGFAAYEVSSSRRYQNPAQATPVARQPQQQAPQPDLLQGQLITAGAQVLTGALGDLLGGLGG